MKEKTKKGLPKKEKKLNPLTVAALGITAIAFGFGLSILHSKISDYLSPSGTPAPDTSNRDNISTCIDNLVEKYCVATTSLDETQGLIAIFTKMIFSNKDLMSESSYNVLFNSSRNVYDAIESFQNNEPGAIEFFSNTSLFKEASGGSVTEKWDLTTVTPNPVNPKPPGTPETVSINPEEHLYVPQIEKDENDNVVMSLKNIDAIGIYFHEYYHLNSALETWQLTGTFEKNKTPYSTEKYQGYFHLEEYQAEFYGDIAQMILIKANGLEKSYYETNEILKLTGVDLPSIALYMDRNGIKPENPLWSFMYDNLSYQSVKFNETMYGVTGNEDYKTEANRIRLRWQSYNWTQEEVDFIKQMEQVGIEEGWILPDTIPQLPEPTSSIYQNTDLWEQLFTREQIEVM